MAEYYPLLVKAVARLKDAPPETRHAVYDRARKALTNQLRSLDPPAAEADIERECQSLDEAVARIEAEMGAPARVVAEPSPPLPAAPPEPRPLTMRPSRPAPTAVPRPIAPVPAASPAESAAMEAATETTIVQPGPPIKRDGTAAMAEAGKGRLEPQRPFAPQPPEPRPPGRRLWIVSAVVAVIVAVVAVAAWRLRDRPEDLAKLRPAASSPQSDAGNGKIVERVGGGPRPDQPAAPRTDQTAQTNAAPAAAPANPTLPVAQRAAMLVEAPDEPNKMKTFLGNVVWRRDNVAAGPGQPLTTAVRADIDIPEDKLQATMIFQKNFDASLPASHTMKINFTVAAGSPTGGVRQISVPQMRREETMAGESLSGVPVPIMENSFLVGLSRGNNENTNLDLIKGREWFDIPILLANGKIAKLTFEKGLSGQRALDDAVAAWQAPQ